MIENEILKAVAEWRGSSDGVELEPLFGDAGSRIYIRLKAKSFKAVSVKVSLSDSPEFGRGNAYCDFISVHDAFAPFIALPEIYYKKDEKGIMIQEDLGDRTLFSLINSSDNKVALLKKAVSLLINWQSAALSEERKPCAADIKKFEEPLFMDEFYHFYEYMIEKRVYYPSFDNLWEKLKPHFQEISEYLSKLPYIVSHRDFQSKNIMEKDGNFYLIDFQDALLSTAVYDLVALLRDSYINLTDAELSELLDFYWAHSNVIKQFFGTKDSFLEAFYMQTVQRKLKDAGRFVFLHQIKGKKWFVPFIRPSLFYVKHALEKLDRKDIIHELAPFVSEFSEGDF